MSRRPTIILALLILTFTIAVSAVGLWKYAYYAYNGLDLAIYTNVLANLAHGAGWWSDVQGHSYLGDHVEPILLFLVPLFRLWPDARLLIIVQALVLGLSAVPVYFLLAREAPSTNDQTNPHHQIPNSNRAVFGYWILDIVWNLVLGIWNFIHGIALRCDRAIILVIIFLFNPLLWNAALFEFHALAFAPLFLLSAAVAYQRRRFGWFALFLLLACAVREDIGLIVAMVGVVAAVQRRQLRWICTPIVLGVLGFATATAVVAAHNPAGSYPFLVYYGWIGSSFGEVLVSVITHPLIVLRHLLRIPNLDFVLGLLLPFIFLPLLAPRWLLLALPPLAQILLSAGGGSNLIVEMHYGLLFLPALTLAAGAALDTFPRPVNRLSFVARVIPLSRHTAIALALGTALAAAWFLGPFRGIVTAVVFGAIPEERTRAGAIREALDALPDDAVVSTTAAPLTALAARPGTTYLPNVALGQQQYAVAPYVLPDATTHLVVIARDLREDLAAFAAVSWSAPYARDAPERLRAALEAQGFLVTARHGDVYTFRRDVEGFEPPPSFFAVPRRQPHRIIGPLRQVEFGTVWPSVSDHQPPTTDY